MAIDFEAIKRKLERLSGNNRSQNVMWKPQPDEEYNVRLISFPNNDGQPFKDSAIIPEQLIPFPYENAERGDPQFDAAINALLGII